MGGPQTTERGSGVTNCLSDSFRASLMPGMVTTLLGFSKVCSLAAPMVGIRDKCLTR